MSNKLFGNLNQDDLETTGDVLGGGGGVFDTDVYDGTIKLVYAGQSQGGARFIAVHVQIGPREYRETLYVTNKKGENWYPNKQDPKKKMPLPGFTTANDLALLSTGFGIGEQDFEEKVINLYDYDQKKEVPTKVMVATEMLGKPIKLAIQKSIVDKNVKDSAGNYVPSGETREENNIEKVFKSDTGMTVSEYTAKKTAPEFQEKWVEKNKGQVRNKATGAQGKTGAPGGAAPAAGASAGKGKSLFT